MTSGQDRGSIAPAPTTVVFCAVASMLIGVVGCSQLRNDWADRPGSARFGIGDRPAPPATASADQPDPYAARVALDDTRPRDRDWIPVPDRPTGAVPAPVAPPAADRPAGAAPGPARTHLAGHPGPVDRPADRPAPAVAAAPPTPAPEPEPEPDVATDEIATIAALVDRGIATLAATRNYRVTLDRQERVRETLLPEETVSLSVRNEPFAVRLEWLDGPNRGREVLYSEAECGGLMHVKLGKTLIPMPPMQLEPDSLLALSNSRYPITEAGLSNVLTKIGSQLESAGDGDERIGLFEHRGPLVPPELDAPCHELLRDTPEGDHWRLLLDEETCLPVLLEATSADGKLLERYRFRDLQTDLEELDGPDAFDPAARFGRTVAGRAIDLINAP